MLGSHNISGLRKPLDPCLAWQWLRKEKRMKYEYMLHTWGGFYNKEHQEKHGYREGYFWFDTKEAREAYISELKEVEQRLKAFCLAMSTEEGEHVRYRTIAKMVFTYTAQQNVQRMGLLARISKWFGAIANR
jgi:hypothetical protein